MWAAGLVLSLVDGAWESAGTAAAYNEILRVSRTCKSKQARAMGASTALAQSARPG
jgi:hypothetical protein